MLQSVSYTHLDVYKRQVWAHEYVEEFPGQQDVLRYALLSSAPETKDNNFTWKDFQTKNNSELVGIFGNFINRVAVLIHKYYDGIIPDGNENAEELNEVAKHAKEIETFLENFEFRNALSSLMNLARFGNQYPVSYTHLDVYKRQILVRSINFTIAISVNINTV